MAGNDEAWNQKCKVLSDDIDRKLDRLEMKSRMEWFQRRLKSLLKEWMLRRLKALGDQLNEQNQAPVRRLKALNDKLPTGDTSAKQKAKMHKSGQKVFFKSISNMMLKPFRKAKSH